MNTLELAAQQWYTLTYQDWAKGHYLNGHPYERLSDRWSALYGRDREVAAWRWAKKSYRGY